MTYIDLASDLVKRLEGCRLTGYLDSVGVPTNGYGHTGPEVRAGQPITQDQADRNLLHDLIRAYCRLESATSPGALDKLRDHQRAALISFVYNVGADPSWTIWKDISAGNLDDVPVQMRRFNKGRVHGKLVVIPGLNNRREAEVAFWNTADMAVAALMARPEGPGTGVDLAPPSHTTVAMITPPTPEPAPPMAAGSLAAKITTVVGGGAAAVAAQAQQIHGVISPYVGSAKVFQSLDTIALGAVVAAGIIGVLIHERQASLRKV